MRLHLLGPLARRRPLPGSKLARFLELTDPFRALAETEAEALRSSHRLIRRAVELRLRAGGWDNLAAPWRRLFSRRSPRSH